MRASLLISVLLFASSALASGFTARELQRELSLDDSKWRLLSESPTSISWVSEVGLAITLNVIPGLNASFPPPTKLDQLREVYRREALSYGGGLVEAEPKPSKEFTTISSP